MRLFTLAFFLLSAIQFAAAQIAFKRDYSILSHSWQGTIGVNRTRQMQLPHGAALPQPQALLGSSGYGVIYKHVLLGGSGWFTLSQSNDGQPRIRTQQGMGFVDVGYIFWARNMWQHFIYGGFGGGGVSARYQNGTDTLFNIAGKVSVAAEETARFNLGGIGWQFGISLNRLLFNPDQYGSGYKVGLDVGYYFFPYREGWTYTGTNELLTARTKPKWEGMYIRFTVGGAWR